MKSNIEKGYFCLIFKAKNHNFRYFSQPDLLVKVPFVFVIMGLVTVGFSAIGLLLIFEKKFNEMPNSSESEILNINDSDSPVEFKRTVEEIDDGKPSLTVKQILKTKEVYMLSVLYEGFFIAPVLFATNFKVMRFFYVLYLRLVLFYFFLNNRTMDKGLLKMTSF